MTSGAKGAESAPWGLGEKTIATTITTAATATATRLQVSSEPRPEPFAPCVPAFASARLAGVLAGPLAARGGRVVGRCPR